MAYNEALAARLDELVKNTKKKFTRKEMFGGVGYLLNGNMCVGVYKDDLIVRFNPMESTALMKKNGVKPFDITGRPMKGWLLVQPEGQKGKQLESWLNVALAFVNTLPKKTTGKK